MALLLTMTLIFVLETIAKNDNVDQPSIEEVPEQPHKEQCTECESGQEEIAF